MNIHRAGRCSRSAGVLTVNVPSKLRPGGRKRVNELRLGGRMSPSNIVRWDAIPRWIASYSVECRPLRMRYRPGCISLSRLTRIKSVIR